MIHISYHMIDMRHMIWAYDMQHIKFLSEVTLLNEATYIEDKSKIDIGLIVLNSLTKEILFNLFRLKYINLLSMPRKVWKR